MRKVLLFLPALCGGGAEKVFVNLCNEFVNNNIDVTLLVIDRPISGKYKDEYSPLLSPKVSVLSLDIEIKKKNYFKMALAIRKAINEVEPDVILSTTLNANLLLAGSLVFDPYANRVIFRETCQRSQLNYSFIKRCVVKFVYNVRCKYIICLTDGMKKDLCDYFGIRENRIVVINNPIDSEKIRSLSEEEIPIKKTDKFTLLSVGRLIDIKDYDTLIDAYAILRKKMDFQAWILGKGELHDHIISRIQEAGLANNVSLLGFDRNPYKYFVRSDVFVLSSKSEGFGLVLLEAMALGVPIVSTACDSGPKEIISNGVDGTLVEVGNPIQLANAIQDLSVNSGKRTMYINNGKSKLKRFEISEIANRYLDVFRQI